ncbi:hypothetical protein KV708_19325 [Comamonas thiooxydans]|uniref:hypothetical protein n=1 Tax=Comamonas thiooxydans TaxID=363952 RepID=UPI00070D5925|nr:hypothetical protein [Comamonas thiooxydans]
MSMTTLLHCPFCGQQPTEYAIEPHTHVLQFAGGKMPDHQGSHVIECACGCGMIEATREAVSARWNRRPIGLPAQHRDDVAVDKLSAAMKAKLAKQRAKGYGGWDDSECTREWLSKLLREHVDKGDPVDVANFCAFLAARGEGIATKVRADAAGDDSALLDAMEQKRIAVVPEYEGPWDAEVYNDDGNPSLRGTGATPREAIRAAIAAAKGK